MKCIKSLESFTRLPSLDICVGCFEWREVWKEDGHWVTADVEKGNSEAVGRDD